MAGWGLTPMDREPIGTGRLPALGGCQATISSSIGVDLPIPEKPTLATARWWPAWRVASPLRKRNTRDATVVIRPEPQQQRGVVPAPLTADPVPRGCSAGAAAQRALAADAPGRQPAAPSLAPTRPTAACCRRSRQAALSGSCRTP